VHYYIYIPKGVVVKRITQTLLAVFMLLGLAACESDSSSRNNSSAISSPLRSGHYYGRWTATDGTLFALVSGGKLHAKCNDGAVVSLDMQLTGTSVTATGHFYYDSIRQGTIQGSGTLEGTDITMKLRRSDGVENVVTLKRYAAFDYTSSFDLI